MRTLFDSDRLTLEEAIDLTADSLRAYGERYSHWAIAYSGGKDSSAAVSVAIYLIETGRVPRPQSLTVLRSDTRLELLPLDLSADAVLQCVRRKGFAAETVLPELDDRFFVYMLGRGVPPPKNRFRWCTPQLKIEPMERALTELRQKAGEKLLMLTGVRVGESAQRDARIALSCTRDGAECGQGWFQESTPEHIADTLAPLLDWRVCHVWEWLTERAPAVGFPTTRLIADAYGGRDEMESLIESNARTGCVGCNLASRDQALERVVQLPHWSYLSPLLELRPLWAELIRPHRRKRKDGSETRADGTLVSNPNRLGPLTMDARLFALGRVLRIQGAINRVAAERGRPPMSLIDTVELRRIMELIAANTWPQRWTGEEITGDMLVPETLPDGSVQQVLYEDLSVLAASDPSSP